MEQNAAELVVGDGERSVFRYQSRRALRGDVGDNLFEGAERDSARQREDGVNAVAYPIEHALKLGGYEITAVGGHALLQHVLCASAADVRRKVCVILVRRSAGLGGIAELVDERLAVRFVQLRFHLQPGFSAF